jgi:predicted Zn finger-like uncharacterized protein
MLFTRCPECATTFRVADEALRKASGQVRCGRCAAVFNALAERVESDAQTPHAADDDDQPSAGSSAAQASVEREAQPVEPPHEMPSPAARSRVAEPPEPAVANSGVGSLAEIVAEAERAAETPDDSQPESAASAATETNPITAEQVEEVLAALGDAPASAGGLPWQPLADTRPRASRWWGVAAALALLALGVQVTNHYRAALAGHPVIGPWTQRAYALLGLTVAPDWDVRQYQILDWVANAEPSTSGMGSLKISARIHNRGPQQQPYPKLQLRLKDRWEKVVASRLFAPEEYLSRDAPHAPLMAAGETAHAQIEVVDPGPDAYGFELDVCIEVEAKTLTCRADKVFR